jgi:hypothetical protein
MSCYCPPDVLCNCMPNLAVPFAILVVVFVFLLAWFYKGNEVEK